MKFPALSMHIQDYPMIHVRQRGRCDLSLLEAVAELLEEAPDSLLLYHSSTTKKRDTRMQQIVQRTYSKR